MKNWFLIAVMGCSALCAAPFDTEEKVARYVHHSELQRRHSWDALSRIQFEGNEDVLDVGCGDGRTTATMARLASKGSVIGVDPSHAMLSWAKKQYVRYEFPNLTFEEGKAEFLPDKEYDLITAFYCLQFTEDKETAVRSLYDHLKPGGKLLVVLPPTKSYNPEFTQALNETIDSLAWRHFFDQEDVSETNEDNDALSPYLRAGFSEIIGEYIPAYDPFVNREEFVQCFAAGWPRIDALPNGFQKPFAREVINRYLELKPEALKEDGAIYGYWGHLEVLAIK